MKRGFSLVELSIVLVILGLLTGGILAGQSLIRASELRAVTSEFERYYAAANTFRDKYLGIPGDFKDATKFWTRQINAPHCVTNSGVATINAASGACDGTGNGIINTIGAANESGETFQFWRHLALAGLVEGTYSGVAGSVDGAHPVPGTNIPTSKLSPGGWVATYLDTSAGGNPTLYTMNYGNLLGYGRQASTGYYGVAITPEEAWNIDTKTDDGKPARGRVIAVRWNDACAAADDGTHSDTDFNASYKLSDKTVTCSLIFKNLF